MDGRRNAIERDLAGLPDRDIVLVIQGEISVQNLLDSVNALGHVIHVDIEDRKFTVEGDLPDCSNEYIEKVLRDKVSVQGLLDVNKENTRKVLKPITPKIQKIMGKRKADKTVKVSSPVRITFRERRR